MAVLSFREVIPRTFRHRFGDAPQADRKFVATLDGATGTQEILNAVGIFHGASHPEYPYLRCVEGNVSETDRFYAEITYRYELPFSGSGGGFRFEPNPLARADVWSFSTGGAQVPALTYYEGDGNADLRPLVNTANEFVYESLTSLEAEVRATIASNRATFPLPIAAEVTNAINATPYLFGARHTWMCAGLNATQVIEVVNNLEITYWQITVELVYRASGWNLFLPNIGLNQLKIVPPLSSPSRVPCVVRNAQGEEVPASSPQALDSNGLQKANNDPPDILGGADGRRIYREIEFAPFFGTPPF